LNASEVCWFLKPGNNSLCFLDISVTSIFWKAGLKVFIITGGAGNSFGCYFAIGGNGAVFEGCCKFTTISDGCRFFKVQWSFWPPAPTGFSVLDVKLS
jgi:hypothetical protein